jgi:hypothetical protein
VVGLKEVVSFGSMRQTDLVNLKSHTHGWGRGCLMLSVQVSTTHNAATGSVSLRLHAPSPLPTSCLQQGEKGTSSAQQSPLPFTIIVPQGAAPLLGIMPCYLV